MRIPQIIETWAGSRVTSERWPLVLQGWQRYATLLRKKLKLKKGQMP